MAAPKGHTFSVGNNGGQPPMYDNVDDLIIAIDEYLKVDGPKTITGLALSLGFASRQSLYDYEKKDKFSYIIKRAKLIVENYYELQLLSGSATGPIFALKNMGWSDKHEVERSNKDIDKVVDAIKGVRSDRDEYQDPE